MIQAALLTATATVESTHTEPANKQIDALLHARDSVVVYSVQSASNSISKQKDFPPSINVTSDIDKVKSKNLPHNDAYYIFQMTTRKKTVFAATVDADDNQDAIALLLKNFPGLLYLTADKRNSPNVIINSVTISVRIDIEDIPFPENVQTPPSFSRDIKPKIAKSACKHSTDKSLESWRVAVSNAYGLSPTEYAYVFFKPFCDSHDSTSQRISEVIAMRSVCK